MSYYFMERGWMEHKKLYTDEPYSRREAWVWMIEHALFAAAEVDIHDKKYKLDRGQLSYSLSYMSKKWKWHVSKVRRFLNDLKNEQMIVIFADIATDIGRDTPQNLISICNYDKYQFRKIVRDIDGDIAADNNNNTLLKNTKQLSAEAFPKTKAADASPQSILIIQAFDAARMEIWGQSQTRIAPAPSDKYTADEWIKSGYTVDFCRQHFREEMSKMFARGKEPPRTLKFFEDSLRSAKMKSPIQLDGEDKLWKSRINDWSKAGTWFDFWGEPPTSPKCQCPKSILQELGLAA